MFRNNRCQFYRQISLYALFYRNALDLLPKTVFPNFPPGGQIDDENNQKAIEALKNAKEYTIVDEEDALHHESILSKYFSQLKIYRNYGRTKLIKHICFPLLDKLIISDPVEFHDRSFMAHLNQLPWSEPLFTRRVEQTVLNGKYMTFCRVSNESISVVSDVMLRHIFF